MTTRRRPKGEGSITKTNNGKYRVRLDCGYFEGKRKQISATCATSAEARKKLREFEKLRAGVNLAVSMEMLLLELSNHYLHAKHHRKEIKESTLAYYRQIVKTLPEWLLLKTLNKINTPLIDKYILSLQEQGFKPRTVRARVMYLSSLFNYAIRTLKITTNNPVSGSIKIDVPDTKLNIEILSEAEHRLLRSILSEHYEKWASSGSKKPTTEALMYLAYMMAYELGIREGEVLGLKWSKINFDERTIIIDNQRHRIPKFGIVDTEPKTKSSIRLLVVSDGLIKILTRHKSLFNVNDYVFSKDFNGKVWSNNSLMAVFKKILKEAGITRRFTFHMIRHTNATRLIEKSGNDYKTVSERLGHSSVSMTFNIYAHAIKKQHQLAATLMDCTQ